VLASHNVALALNAWTRMPALDHRAQLPRVLTADFTVVRLCCASGDRTTKLSRPSSHTIPPKRSMKAPEKDYGSSHKRRCKSARMLFCLSIPGSKEMRRPRLRLPLKNATAGSPMGHRFEVAWAGGGITAATAGGVREHSGGCCNSSEPACRPSLALPPKSRPGAPIFRRVTKCDNACPPMFRKTNNAAMQTARAAWWPAAHGW
jgi:hypothetical protein